jgi:hypothetical protein
VNPILDLPTTARERIDLGVLALLTTSPASTLVEMCERLRQLMPTSETNVRLDKSVAEGVALPFTESGMAFFDHTIESELKALSRKGPIAEGAAEVAALFRAGFALRTLSPVLEQTFVGICLSVDDFKNIIGSRFPDYCVLQKKSGNRIEYQWIGPGIVGPDVAPVAIFQAAMHFSGLHFRRGILIPTRELPDTVCPYSGGCQAEIDSGNPKECKTQPWNRYLSAEPEQPICWYAQGVKSLIKRNVTDAIAPTPSLAGPQL